MRRCLIVANQTLNSPALAEAVKQRIDADEHTFFVVVPATPLKDHVGSFPGSAANGSSPQDRAYVVAVQRLDQALDQLREFGATADGEIGDPDEFDAAQTAIQHFQPDEILLSTLPPRLSHWLRRDLPVDDSAGQPTCPSPSSVNPPPSTTPEGRR